MRLDLCLRAHEHKEKSKINKRNEAQKNVISRCAKDKKKRILGIFLIFLFALRVKLLKRNWITPSVT